MQYSRPRLDELMGFWESSAYIYVVQLMNRQPLLTACTFYIGTRYSHLLIVCALSRALLALTSRCNCAVDACALACKIGLVGAPVCLCVRVFRSILTCGRSQQLSCTRWNAVGAVRYPTASMVYRLRLCLTLSLIGENKYTCQNRKKTITLFE